MAAVRGQAVQDMREGLRDVVYLLRVRLEGLHRGFIRDEEDLRNYRSTYLHPENNPYEFKGESRKLFEWIKPVQVSALNRLVSCGILSKSKYEAGRVSVADHEALTRFLDKTGNISGRERTVLSFLSMLSRHMSMSGEYGLKARTKLLESKYDAE